MKLRARPVMSACPAVAAHGASTTTRVPLLSVSGVAPVRAAAVSGWLVPA